MKVITMWLAVDESRVENGCMRVVAGSHRRRGLRYEEIREEGYLFSREVVGPDLSEADVVDLELRQGESHFHDAFTPARLQRQPLRGKALRIHHALLPRGRAPPPSTRQRPQPLHIPGAGRGPFRRSQPVRPGAGHRTGDSMSENPLRRAEEPRETGLRRMAGLTA